ncbi:hypothetical protein GCM10023085_02290 [Actinomadura viridis]
MISVRDRPGLDRSRFTIVAVAASAPPVTGVSVVIRLVCVIFAPIRRRFGVSRVKVDLSRVIVDHYKINPAGVPRSMAA